MSLITGFLDLAAPIAGRLFASPLWTPATALAVTAEVLWLANALALLFWLARPARPRRHRASLREMASPTRVRHATIFCSPPELRDQSGPASRSTSSG